MANTPKKQSKLPGSEARMQPAPEYIKAHYQSAGKLNGKTALITGGDSGIGRAVAVHYAREGADIAIVYLSEDRDAKDTQQLVEETGRRCLLIPGDIQAPAFCKKAVEKTVKTWAGSISW